MMDIVNIFTIIFVPIGIAAAIYVLWAESFWSTVWIKSAGYSVDNTQSDYYKKNGFHEYDTMSDRSYRYCTFEIQFNKRTNEYRVKHKGDYTDFKIQEIAYNELSILNEKRNPNKSS